MTTADGGCRYPHVTVAVTGLNLDHPQTIAYKVRRELRAAGVDRDHLDRYTEETTQPGADQVEVARRWVTVMSV